MKTKLIYLACILLILVSGCAKPPVAEMDSAREAVMRAENDRDAVVYGGGSLARARDSLRRMEVEANSKRYDAAKTLAAEAIAAAEKAIADGKTGAVRAREEAAALLSGLKPAIEETEQGINAARTAAMDLDYTELDQELTGARRDTQDAENAMADSEYQNALDKGRKARAALSDINYKLTNAVTAASRKK
jgi:hypothetical protein